MAKKKSAAKPLLRATSTCEVSSFLAYRLFDEKIDVPEGVALGYDFRNMRDGELTARHPLLDFYQQGKIWCENVSRARGKYIRPEDRAKANIAQWSARELRDFIGHIRSEIRNWKTISRMDHLFEISDAHYAMSLDLKASLELDDNGKKVEPIGLDVAFIRMAENKGICREQLEASLYHEIQHLIEKSKVNEGISPYSKMPRNLVIKAVRQGFGNLTAQDFKNLGYGSYRNMNELFDPVFARLNAFNGCIWGAKPLATNMVLGEWLYTSNATPSLMADKQIPESIQRGLKGRPVNELVDVPVFGDSQTIMHVETLKNGKLMIKMTPETLPFAGKEERSRIDRAA